MVDDFQNRPSVRGGLEASLLIGNAFYQSANRFGIVCNLRGEVLKVHKSALYRTYFYHRQL
jgi:hypothetical protein